MTMLFVLLLQSTVLLALGLLAVRLTRRRGPAVQSLVGRAALVGVGLLVLLAPLIGHLRIPPVWYVTLKPTPQQVATLPKRETSPGPVGTSPGPSSRGGTEDAAVDQSMAVVPGAARASEGAARQQGAASSAPTHSFLPSGGGAGGGSYRTGGGLLSGGGLYAVVTFTLLLWLALCQWHLFRLRRTTRVVADSSPAAALLAALTPDPPALLTHPAIHSPFLAGLRHPAIFLPADYEAAFPPDALRAIFVHELAHRDRQDNAWTLAARLLCALLWFQPLLWLLVHRLEHLSEDACDEAVLASNCPPRAYADCLLSLATRPPLPHRPRTLTAGVAPYRSSVGRRISRILSAKGVPAMTPLTPRLRLTAAALSLTAALGGVFLISSAPAQVHDRAAAAAPALGMPLIVGTWLYQNQPISGGKEGLITYQPNGKFAYLFPGTARHEPEQSFGTYIADGKKLKEFTTHASFDDPNKIGHSDILPINVNYTVMRFSISGNTLTIRDGSGEISVAKRLSPAEAAAKRQRILRSATGTASDTVIYAEGNIRITGVAPNQQASQARYLAGLTPVQGPGVIVTLTDSKKPLPGSLPSGMTPPNLIHDTDINQVVNELKAAGAEAIAVNGQRLVATSAIRSAGAVVFVNNTPLGRPYIIQAIGDPKTLTAQLAMHGGIASQIRLFDPAMFSAIQSTKMVISAYVAGRREPRYAKPVGQ